MLRMKRCVEKQRQSWRGRQRRKGTGLMVRGGASNGATTTTTTETDGQNVVVTGSTRGLGRALALEFLKAGDRVCISSRKEEDVRECVRSLEREYGNNAVSGQKCDVSIAEDVEQLATTATKGSL